MDIDYSKLYTRPPFPTGWHRDLDEVDRVLSTLERPIFGDSATSIKGSGKGKIALLYLNLLQVRGSYPSYIQEIGSCVGHGYSRAAMHLKAIQLSKSGGAWDFDIPSEDIYGGSRVEIGGGRLWGDGSVGAWAARYIKEYGTLQRKVYETRSGRIDLSRLDSSREKAWGRSGVPDELEPIARERPVEDTSLIRSYEEARDALYNQRLVVMCSMLGLSSKRDAEGFARRSGSWAHCMILTAVDDESRRPGCLVDNRSWPHDERAGRSWISGPKRHDQPDGTAWVDADEIDRRCREGDTFAISSLKGYEPDPWDYSLLWKRPTVA